MNKHNTIHGMKRDFHILNSEEVDFINDLKKKFSRNIIGSNGKININKAKTLPDFSDVIISTKLTKILDKISSLSFIQDNIEEIFDGYDLKNSESMKKLFKNFDFNGVIKDPNVLNEYRFENKLSRNNKKKFSNKSYIQNITQNINAKSKIGKSVLIFFFILQKMVDYIKTKRSNFDDLIRSGRVNNISKVNAQKLDQATKAYQGFIFLMKKFLKIREKIFFITQLEYVEAPIPKDTIINNIVFFYYHFFKEIIDNVLKNINSSNKGIQKYSDFIKLVEENKIKLNLTNIEFVSNNYKFDFNRNPIMEISNYVNLLLIKKIYSVAYLKDMELLTIISKRNKSYFMFQYEISIDNQNNSIKIIKSERPKIFVLDKNILNNNEYGQIIKLSYYK